MLIILVKCIVNSYLSYTCAPAYLLISQSPTIQEQKKQVKSFSQRIVGVLRSLKATLLSNRTEKEQKQKSIRKVATSESDKETVTAVVKSH